MCPKNVEDFYTLYLVLIKKALKLHDFFYIINNKLICKNREKKEMPSPHELCISALMLISDDKLTCKI